MYRIVAVVSLPQTAFTATGAGVKSSVLFLKKNTAEQTKKIKNTKQELQDSIKKQQRYYVALDALEEEKENELTRLKEKELDALRNPENINAYKLGAKEVSDRYAERVEELRYRLIEIYEERKGKMIDDYNIFMAMAEDIGYDATGRTTKINELDVITTELAHFIEAIEGGKE